ncbi:MAG: carbon-nitrogen hydrolase family protein, partial [Verrucomicrobia bacterium]|nr:carbon-nitrogen hydrolase family protein [Verrucomicrobiota bacterium]
MNTRLPGLLLALLLTSSATSRADSVPADDWQTAAPRGEIGPLFSRTDKGGRDGKGSLVIASDKREGLIGHWTKIFAIKGGAYHHFEAWRHCEGVDVPRRAAVVRVIWQDDKGKQVTHDEVSYASYRPG